MPCSAVAIVAKTIAGEMHLTAATDILPQTIAYHILQKLRWRIITGDFMPGQALREQELEIEYGSSRGPIRESQRLLLQTGLVEHLPRRGFRVRSYTADDIRNIYELRAMLEAKTIDNLAGRNLEALVETLEGRCKVMEGCYKRRDLEGYFHENSAFHQCIIDFTENRPIAQVLYYVNEISLPVRYRLLTTDFPSRRSLDYHEDITRQIKVGRLAKAKAVTEAHILENLDRAISVFAAHAGP